MLSSWVGAALAGSAPGGPAFTDPEGIVPMPPEWGEAPVVYERWAAGADLAVTLDQHLYPALLPLIQEYARERGIRIAVQEGTCGISAGKLEGKHADIGGFCCPAGYSDRLPGLRFHTLGIASLALLTHAENPVESVSLREARRLFQGHVSHWDAVKVLSGSGGRAERVRPIARLHCKARPGHWRLLLSDQDRFSPRLREVSTIPDMISGVASSKGAIGYETLWMVEHNGGTGRVRTLKIDGVMPESDGQLVRGDYPLYRTYNLTTWEGVAANPHAGKLVAWLMENSDRVDPRFGIIPATRLREAGWLFRDQELIGEPGESPGGGMVPLSSEGQVRLEDLERG